MTKDNEMITKDAAITLATCYGIWASLELPSISTKEEITFAEHNAQCLMRAQWISGITLVPDEIIGRHIRSLHNK